MELNIHPVFVHFPIAFLTFYALFEILQFRVLTRQSWYTPIKCIFLFLGTLSGFAALQTGEMAEEIVGESRLMEIHATWASITIWIFGVLSVCYILLFISRTTWFMEHVESKFKRAGTLFPAMAETILKIAPLGALVGLVAVTITGSLGGAIVYGPDADPIVRFVYNLFMK